MTSILLDTNAVIWLLRSPDRIADAALAQLEDPANPLFVSAASAWEIAIKSRRGRIDGTPILASWPERISALGADELDITAADAILAGQLDWDHRDPFDRMIVAQAARRGLTIATSDSVLQAAALTPVLRTE